MKRYSDAWLRRRDANAEQLKKTARQVPEDRWWAFYHLIAIKSVAEIPAARWREIVTAALAEIQPQTKT